MSWSSLILTLLKIAEAIFDFARDRQLIQAGADAEIAKASASVLLKTRSAKQVMAEVTAMSDDQVDKALKELEP